METPDGYELDKESSTFDHIVFKKKASDLPETWNEYEDKHIPNWSNYTHWEEWEDAEAATALSRLVRLRDCYNEGWRPNWEDGYEIKYCLVFSGNKLCKTTLYGDQCVLAFKTGKLREKFLVNFEDLIKKAKPLL